MLASACSSVKLWSLSSHNLVQEIASTGGNVSSLSWNKDGNFLASLSPSSSEISLHTVKSRKSASTVDVFKIVDQSQCLQFARKNSRYLAVGGAKNSVVIWDIKEKLRKKQFKLENASIKRLCFNNSDSHLGICTNKGNFYTLSISNNNISGPVKMFDLESPAMDGEFCHANRSLFGAAGECGSISFIDINTMKVLRKIKGSHNAPASGLRFSPINDLLLATVGYDKKFVTYNVNTKKEIMSQQASQPLTSLCFMADGASIAMGTMTGKILFYDLRALTHPTVTLDVDRWAVKDIALMPIPKSTNIGAEVCGISNLKRNVNVLKKDPYKSLLQPPSNISKLKSSLSPCRSERVISPSLEILSPIRHSENIELTLSKKDEKDKRVGVKWVDREILSPISSVTEFNQDQSISSSMSNYSLSRDTSSKHIDLDDQDILSPVKVDGLSTSESSASNCSPMKNKQGVSMDDLLSPVRSISSPESKSPGSQSCLSPLTPILKNKISSNSIQKPLIVNKMKLDLDKSSKFIAGNCLNDMENLANKIKDTVNDDITNTINSRILSNVDNKYINQESSGANVIELKSSLPNLGMSNKENLITVENSLGNSDVLEHCKDSVCQMISGLNVSNQVKSDEGINKDVQHSEVKKLSNEKPCIESASAISKYLSSEMHEEVKSSSTLNLDLVRSLVNEALNNHQAEVNSRFMHMQYVMIKNFYTLKKELTQLIEENSLNDELLEENLRLREEINQLRSTY